MHEGGGMVRVTQKIDIFVTVWKVGLFKLGPIFVQARCELVTQERQFSAQAKRVKEALECCHHPEHRQKGHVCCPTPTQITNNIFLYGLTRFPRRTNKIDAT